MCFYLPWITALVLWLLLLRSLKKHDERFTYSFAQSITRTSRENPKSNQTNSETEAPSSSVKYMNLPRTHSKNTIAEWGRGVPLRNLKEDDTVLTFGRRKNLLRQSSKSSKSNIINSQSLLTANNSCKNRFLSITKQRSKNISRITLTVVILCFTNLICR
jgi:hypothetical protein